MKENDALAAQLRCQGLTYGQIADRLGCTRREAYEAVSRAVRSVQ